MERDGDGVTRGHGTMEKDGVNRERREKVGGERNGVEHKVGGCD